MTDEFVQICKSLKLEPPIKEYRFCKDRRWRIDYCWPDIKFACELEGGVWSKGRHITPSGFIKDMEKYNRLSEEGWCLVRYMPTKIDWDQIERLYWLHKAAFKEMKQIYL